MHMERHHATGVLTMPSKPIPDRFLNIKEVAELIGLDWTTIRDGRADTNEIPRIRLGRRVVFSENAVQAWMAEKAREAEERKQQSRMAIHSMRASQSERQRSVKNTLITFINGGRYK